MTEEQFILSIDQGTTSSRALLVNQKGEIVASSQQEFEQIFRRSGWVEHDAVEIWRSVQSVIAELMIEAEITHKKIAAIGIANQRETTVIWDRKTEQPVAPAIVWQSRQSQDIAEELVRSGYQDLIQEKTGLLIDAYYSATKIRWLLDHIEDGQKRAEQGDLMFGTIDAWILYKLTGGQVHATDYSNASRTMLFNIHDLTWDQDILEILNIPKELLPDVKSNSEVYGYTASRRFFGGQVPIAGMAGDQQASMIGQQCFEAGMTKNTYGTGSFIMMNLGSTAFISNHKLATTIAYVIDEEVNYALEGSVFVTGSAVQWLRDGLQLFKSADETEAMAMASSNSDDLYIVPAFTGLGAPYWKSDARGAIFGLNRSTNQNDFAQAVLRSIAYQSQDVLTTMCKDTGMSVQELHVDGGAAENDYLLQFQADISNTDLVRAENVETTALGVAFLAGLAVGFWQDLDEIQSLIQLGQAFYPNMDSEQREKLLTGWAKAVSATIFYAEEE